MSVTRRHFMPGAALLLNGAKGLAAEYINYDALGLAELIVRKQITQVELLRAVRDRTEALNSRLNAFCHLFFDRAEAQIRQLPPTGPFRGVPFALKDLGQYVAGTITSAGSRVLKDSVASFDSTYVERAKRAGLIIFGKTNTPEMGTTFTTESALYGATRNPWNLERTSGGSSGGSSSAVAARILPAAHATDGGGSIRVPASCCGLFGLKPTRGRVPMGPSQFEGWAGQSAHHAVTISVRDSAALLDATAGEEPGSPFFVPKPLRPFLAELNTDPGKLRIALMVTDGVAIHRECQQAVLEAAKLCESLGHRVEEKRLPLDLAKMRAERLPLIRVGVARTLDDAVRVLGRELRKTDVEPATWDMYQAAKRVDGIAYASAVASMHQTGLVMARFHENYDVMLSPVLAKPPVALGVLGLSNPDLAREIAEFSPFTSLQNVTGQPSMSVPLHWTSDGLPVGVMFSGRFGEEGLLLRLAAQLERAKPWANRRPPGVD